MNAATFFQKYQQKRFVNILRRLYELVMLRNPGRRIRYLRSAGAVIGENVFVSDISVLGTEPYLVEVGDNSYLAGGTTQILTHDGACSMTYHMGLHPEKCDFFGRVKIGKNCFVGFNCIIMKNVTIGDNCIIGAGSVVTKSIPDNSVACGVPAKVICSTEDWVEKNKEYFDKTKGLNQYEKRMYVMQHMDKYEALRKAREA